MFSQQSKKYEELESRAISLLRVYEGLQGANLSFSLENGRLVATRADPARDVTALGSRTGILFSGRPFLSPLPLFRTPPLSFLFSERAGASLSEEVRT